MEDVRKVLQTLDTLCDSINHFRQTQVEASTYRSPIIDHAHPDDYSQKAVTGLTKFLNHAENERDYVRAILESGKPPKDLTTNAPNILAIWDEFLRSPRPLCSITHHLDCGSEGQIRVDVVGDGGNLWVKVNTIKASRLMAEFREQDSYINSDYDSDSAASSSSSPSPPSLTNSLIVQAESLVRASKAFARPVDLPPPRIRFVLNRMEELPEGDYDDDRIPATFAAIRAMGVELVLGSQPVSGSRPRKARRRIKLRPTRKILLDLSVIVALCCDSTHQPLPTTEEELELRFRPLKRDANGSLVLAEHTNVSKDLRDQLAWESRHPVVEEIQARLKGYREEELEWFVTREVKDRTPAIVDLIGGPSEQARARALYGESDVGFWSGSRYEGRQGLLRNLHVSVLEDHVDISKLSLAQQEIPLFEKGIISVCQRMIGVVDGTPSEPSRPASPAPAPPTPSKPGPKRGRRLRNAIRANPLFPQPQKLPSAHTLKTMLYGVESGITVLTNNRGAVGKVIRELGVPDGFPFDHGDEEDQSYRQEGSDESDGKSGVEGAREVERRAVLWVVNPSSLAEWRRLEVEETNAALLAESDNVGEHA